MSLVKDVKSSLVTAYMCLMRRFRMTPMRRVQEELKRRHVNLRGLHALDMFGSDGDLQTMDFAPEVASLEVWEINPDCEEGLRRNLPNATIRMVDAFEEIRRTEEKFDLIVVDAPTCVYGPEGTHCEHFDLLPDLFRVCRPAAIIVLNVVPRIPGSRLRKARRNGESSFGPEHLARRAGFYGTSMPERAPYDQMILAYERIIRRQRFAIDWHFFKRKHGCYHYLVFRVKRVVTAEEEPPSYRHLAAPPLVGSDP